MKMKRVEFTPPKDFPMPEGITANEDFDLVCTFRLKDSGDVCLVMCGDAKMPGYDGQEKSESKPSYADMAPKPMNEYGNQS